MSRSQLKASESIYIPRDDLALRCLLPAEFRIRPKDVAMRESIRRELESQLRREFEGLPIELHLFGSSANGFGLYHSDVDLCMTTGDSVQVRGCLLSGVL